MHLSKAKSQYYHVDMRIIFGSEKTHVGDNILPFSCVHLKETLCILFYLVLVYMN